MDKPACVNCVYYVRTPPEIKQGQCRRFPPQANIVVQRAGGPSGIVGSGQMAVQTICTFPTVQGDAWCGEYRKKEEWHEPE